VAPLGVAVTISVIIPTLNEATCIARTVASLRSQSPCEVLVVDGGSTDGTRELASGARVLEGARGRAAQMNHGAVHARGDHLLFLHADCELEDDALVIAERCLSRSGVAAGCFQMTVQAPGILYRLIDGAATARVGLTGLIYGDQGLFVSRRLFEKVRGFPLLRLMEDVFISKTLRQHGRMVVAPRRIFVSPRRWQQHGIIRQSLRNWTLTALAAAGVHPDRLAQFYPVIR
jgi:rSAM/selenodomain-associated transferase 2